MKYNCIIVDDEPSAIKILSGHIESVEQLELIGVYYNVLQIIELFAKEKIDILFLDIEMSKILDMESIMTLQHPPKVIFTSSHKEFALEAFDLDAMDYLLKPISFERFLKAAKKLGPVNTIEENKSNSSNGFLFFRSQRKIVKVFLEDILYIESLKDYIGIHRDQKSLLKVKHSIYTLESSLPKDLFLRVHRSFIVSTQKITAFTKNDVEIGKFEIPIGRSYKSNIDKLLFA